MSSRRNRWRLWRRVYDVYLGKTQVAAVDERPLLSFKSWFSFQV